MPTFTCCCKLQINDLKVASDSFEITNAQYSLN